MQVVPHDILACTPDRARVLKGTSLSLDIAMSIMVPRAISTYVALDVHAGKAARLMVKADVVLPAIEVAEASFEFGEVSIGATTKLPVTITNPSPVSAGEQGPQAVHSQILFGGEQPSLLLGRMPSRDETKTDNTLLLQL